MAVLLENMEMPKGELGAIPIMIYADGDVEHFFSHEKYGKAIEVTEPHGRLIDADALINDYPRTWSTYALQRIENAPTIIPASEEAE